MPDSLPADAYELTAADRRRFAEEAALGMIDAADPLLNRVARPVAPDALQSESIRAVIDRLHAAAAGQRQGRKINKKRRTLVGLAAPQIGEGWRIVLIDMQVKADRRRPGRLICLINPEIIWRSRETEEGREGCFSAGPVWGLVRRPIAIKLRALTPQGTPVEYILEDFTARIAQHEIDHLNGIRFPDRIRSDRKRHWVHTEELPDYPRQIKQWPRICSRDR